MTHRKFLALAAVLGSTALATGILTLIPVPTAGAATLTSLNIDFGTTTTTPVSGYTLDDGAAFNSTTGFGWQDNSSGAPLSIVGNGRERDVHPGTLGDTLMQMQLETNSSGVHTPAKWSANVANGTYNLTVGVGDPSYIDSVDVLNANGTQIVNFTPTAATPQTVVHRSVTITNGSLTIDPNGGTNSKIDYVSLTPAGSSALNVTSPDDYLGVGSRLVFSTVKNQNTPGESVTLKNTGSTTLNVTGLTIGGTNGGDFKLCSGQPTGFSITPGASSTACVAYRPVVNATTNGSYASQGTLTIATDSTSTPSYVVTLGGVDSADYGSYHEPNLQLIFQGLGFTDAVKVSNNPQGNSISATNAAVGDEILAPYFKALNTSQPVHLYPIAHYSGQDANDTNPFGWYAKGSSSNNYLYNLQGGANGSNNGWGQNQMLLPAFQACNGTPKFTCTGKSSFSPGGSFGIVDDYPGYINHSDDALNAGGWHDMRVYPAKDGNGNIVSGEYLIGDDIGAPEDNSAKNWDYQDFAYLLTNATPDTAAKQPVAGDYNRSLSSFPGNAGGIDGSGFTSAQGTVTASKISYSNNNINIVTSNDSNTSHTNALQLGVNAGTPFRVQSRLVGPFNAINAGAEQQGIYFGPNANNYIKAEVEWSMSDNKRHLSIWEEKNGSGTIIRSIDLPGNNANTIDLRIDVDPSPQLSGHYNGDPLVQVAYSLNGGSFTSLQTSDIVIPPSWITANTPAGLVTSNQQGGSPFTATYANFSISRIPYFVS